VCCGSGTHTEFVPIGRSYEEACPRCNGAGRLPPQEAPACECPSPSLAHTLACAVSPSSSASSFAERARTVASQAFARVYKGQGVGWNISELKEAVITDFAAFAQQSAAESEAKYAPLVNERMRLRSAMSEAITELAMAEALMRPRDDAFTNELRGIRHLLLDAKYPPAPVVSQSPEKEGRNG
jgi:hypothetical protein